MKWTKITLDTMTEAVDLISCMLSELGIEGIEISDKLPLSEEDKKRMFVDILPDPVDNDNSAAISFYIDSSEDLDGLLRQVKEGLLDLSGYVSIGSGKLTVSETEDKDWINNWKQFFKPFRIDKTIVIKPTWEELTDRSPEDLVIEIDPGISFGTGSHETTKLCILSLKKYVRPGDTVLDAGSGSGILSIIAKKLGAGEVLGVDIDPLAINAAIENAAVNRIDAVEWTGTEELVFNKPVKFATGNVIEDEGIRSRIGRERYNLVIANILADVIIPLSGVMKENMKDGAVFICSGIINTKEEEVKNALENNRFAILEVNRMGDWVSFVARK